MHKIFVAENIPSLNKGELTILMGMIESFRNLGDFEVSIISALEHIDKPRYGNQVKIIDANKSLHLHCDPLKCSNNQALIMSIFITFQHMLFLALYALLKEKALKIMGSDIWKAYVTSDAIFIGHNGTFGLCGGVLPNVPLLPYLSYIYLPIMNKILNKPLIIYGGSVGSFRQSHRYMWRWLSIVLKNINLVTLREPESYKNLLLMNTVCQNAFITADLAFLLKPATNINDIIKREGLDKRIKPFIGMTITREIASKSYPGIDPKINYNSHLKIIAEIADYIISKFNATIIFIPHCIGFGDNLDDRIIARDIYKLIRNKEQVILIENEYSAEELKGLLGCLDLFIGERLHSVINAMTMNVPSIVISYAGDQRLHIIKMIGQEECICHVENLDTSTLTFKIDDFFGHRKDIKDTLKNQIAAMIESSNQNHILLKRVLNGEKN